VGLLDRLRGKPTAQEDNSAINAMANAQVYTRNQTSAQEAEDRQNKGIDFNMIYAEQAVQQLSDMAYIERMELQDVPFTDKDGKPAFEQVPMLDVQNRVVYQDIPIDANGTILVTKKPIMVNKQIFVKQLMKVVETHVWASAALVYIDSVLPTIWMGSWEADTAKLYIRAAFIDIRQQMRDDPLLSFQQKKDCVVLLTAVRDLALFRLEDCKEGRKPLLLKVKREELGVHMSRGNVQGK